MTESTFSCNSARRRPLRRPYISRCSRTVNCESIAVNCGHTPNDRRADLGWCTTDVSRTKTSPESGTTSPPVGKSKDSYKESVEIEIEHTYNIEAGSLPGAIRS